MGLPAAADRGADRLTDRVIAPTLFRPYRPCARRAPMVTRKKNLLEVLRPTAAHAPRPSSSPGSEVPIGAFAARARPRLALSNKKTVQLALVFVVAVGGAYWLGRQHSPGVAAASSAADEGLVPGALLRPSQTAAPAAPPVDVAAANMQSAQSGSADDKAFLLDLTNRYTIRLIQYSDDAAATASPKHMACFRLLLTTMIVCGRWLRAKFSTPSLTARTRCFPTRINFPPMNVGRLWLMCGRCNARTTPPSTMSRLSNVEA